MPTTKLLRNSISKKLSSAPCALQTKLAVFNNRKILESDLLKTIACVLIMYKLP